MADASHSRSFVDGKLAEILDAIATKVSRGQSFDLEAEIEKHPELESDLRKLLPAMELMCDWGSRADLTKSADLPLMDPGLPSSSTLGDYQILRELGRGGMGVVYEAQQLSLDRRVALKVLPMAAFLDERQLRRFKNEARAAAMLQHPGIVSVHGVGCERSIHFYAMELISGADLASVVRDLHHSSDPRKSNGNGNHAPESVDTLAVAGLSTKRSNSRHDFFRSIAELGVQAADALQYAHGEGVVHRDIKPANLLLDEQGKLHVTDFGLARVQAFEDLTLTGDILGTLRYMSPEQISGYEVVDHRTDIYSLGLTIYETLVGRVVFDDSNRGKLTNDILHKQPAKLRDIDSTIPVDLETIVLRAISKHPSDRYRTARELSKDLQRFIENRPVKARRPSKLRTAWQWCSRNPAIAGSLTLVAVAILGGLLATSLQLRRALAAEAESAHEIFVSNTDLAYQAWNRGDVYGARDRLSVAKEKSELHRNFPWQLLNNAISESQSVKRISCDFRPMQTIISPDKQSVFVSAHDKITKWSIATHEKLWQVDLAYSPFRNLLLNNNGQLITNQRQQISVIDSDTGDVVIESVQHDLESSYNVLALSNDHKQVYVLSSGYGKIPRELAAWTFASNSWKDLDVPREETIANLAFSPSGDHIATIQTDDHSVWLRKANDWEPVAELGRHDGRIALCKFSADSRLLLTGPRNQIALLGQERRTIIYDIERQEETETWINANDGDEVVLSPDDRLALSYSGSSGSVELLDRDSRTSTTFRGHADRIANAVWSADSTLFATTSMDGSIILRNVPRKSANAAEANNHITNLQIVNNQTAFFTGEDIDYNSSKRVAKLNIETGEATTFVETNGYPTGVGYSHTSERLYISQSYGKVDAWQLSNLAEPSMLNPVSEHSGDCELTISDSGDLLAVCEYGLSIKDNHNISNVTVWDVSTETPKQLFEVQHNHWAVAVDFSSDDGLLAAGDWESELKVWDCKTGKQRFGGSHRWGRIWSLRFSPDGKTIATGGSDGEIHFWDVATESKTKPSIRHEGEIFALCYSPDGLLLVTTGLSGSILFWDVETRRRLGKLSVDGAPIRSMEFTPDGKSLVCVHADCSATVLSIKQPEKTTNEI